MAAYFGEENLCLMLYDNPRLAEIIAEKFTELYTATVQKDIGMRRLWQGGYVSCWGLFVPDKHLDYQADASNMLDVQMYKKFFLKYDERIIGQFPSSLFHVHSCGIHIIETLLHIESLKIIQVQLDREAVDCDLNAIIRVCKDIQKSSKSVLICGQLTDDELAMIEEALRPEGLAIFYWSPLIARK
jgi:hypothetical protein